MSVARFVADQRTMHRVPHTVSCAILGISISWFYKWVGRGPTERARRRAALDARVRELFEASKATYGSPRIHADLVEAGEKVSVNTVADSMRRQGLQGRKPKRRRGLTRQDRTAPKFPDLLHRDFTAPAPNVKWCGDITEIPTDEGKLYLGLGAGPAFAPAAGQRDLGAPRRRAGLRRDQDGRGGARRARGHRRGDLPHRSRIYLHGNEFSPRCAESSGCRNRWDGSVHVSITLPRRRSSPPSNTRSCPGTNSPRKPTHARLSWPGARTSTTADADTARPH